MIQPPAYAQPAPEPDSAGRLSLLAALAFNQGGLVLVDPPMADAWHKGLSTAAMEDLRDDLLIRWVKAGSPDLASLGLKEPGVYLLSTDGRRLAVWSSPPPDLPDALRAAGWKSLDDRYDDLLKSHPERVDLAWIRFERSQARWLRSPSEPRAEACARELDRLLRSENWAVGRSVFLKTAGGGSTSPGSLVLEKAAFKHMSTLVELVRAQPEAASAWNLIAFLVPLHPEPPRLDRLLMDLEPGPELDPAFWPFAEAVNLAVDQRRTLKDWPGMVTLARSRLDALDARAVRFHSSVADAWSGRMMVQGDKITKFSRRDETKTGFGYWLAVWLEAALESGLSSQVEEATRRLAAEGDGASRSRGIILARQKGRDDLARQLREAN